MNDTTTTLAEHRIIREAIADALADHGEEL